MNDRRDLVWSLIVKRQGRMPVLAARRLITQRNPGKFWEDSAGQLMRFAVFGETWDMKVVIIHGDGKAIRLEQAGVIRGLTKGMDLRNLLPQVNTLLTRLMEGGRVSRMGSGRILVIAREA